MRMASQKQEQSGHKYFQCATYHMADTLRAYGVPWPKDSKAAATIRRYFDLIEREKRPFTVISEKRGKGWPSGTVIHFKVARTTNECAQAELVKCKEGPPPDWTKSDGPAHRHFILKNIKIVG